VGKGSMAVSVAAKFVLTIEGNLAQDWIAEGQGGIGKEGNIRRKRRVQPWS